MDIVTPDIVHGHLIHLVCCVCYVSHAPWPESDPLYERVVTSIISHLWSNHSDLLTLVLVFAVNLVSCNKAGQGDNNACRAAVELTRCFTKCSHKINDFEAFPKVVTI